MGAVLERVRAFYGARPLHLFAVLVSIALAGYTALHLAPNPAFLRILVWFAGAVVAHDLILFPLYTLADRCLTAATHRRSPRSQRPRVPVINHIRVPALAAGLLLLLYFPGILRLGSDTFGAATGQTQHPFAARWLLLTAVFFSVSALVYAARFARTARG